MDEHRATQPQIETEPVEERSLAGRIRLWGGLLGAILLIVFLLQNLDDASVQFLFWDFDIPLIFALIASAVLGAVASMLIGFFRRRAKETRTREHAALQRERDRTMDRKREPRADKG